MDARERDRRDNRIMLLVTVVSGVVIAIVLYFAGAFMKSTG
jgi:hypothetical protein